MSFYFIKGKLKHQHSFNYNETIFSFFPSIKRPAYNRTTAFSVDLGCQSMFSDITFWILQFRNQVTLKGSISESSPTCVCV